MQVYNLSDFRAGWFLGNFTPSIDQSKFFEVAVKKFLKGEKEPAHYQKIATEITVVVSGKIRLGVRVFNPNEIIRNIQADDFTENNIFSQASQPSRKYFVSYAQNFEDVLLNRVFYQIIL